jgi:hypothetical protein
MINLGNLYSFPELDKASLPVAKESIERALQRQATSVILEPTRQAMARRGYTEIATQPLNWFRVNSESNIESISLIHVVCAAFVHEAAREILKWHELHLIAKRNPSFGKFLEARTDAALEAAFDALVVSIVGAADNGFVAQYKHLVLPREKKAAADPAASGRAWSDRNDGRVSWLAKRLPFPDNGGGQLFAAFALDLAEHEPTVLDSLHRHFFAPQSPAIGAQPAVDAFTLLQSFASDALQQWLSPACSDVRSFLPNLILEGVPGTGKTFALARLREFAVANLPATDPLREAGSGRFAMTMHPATTYEDFVEGLRPLFPQAATGQQAASTPPVEPQAESTPPSSPSIPTEPPLKRGYWEPVPPGPGFEIRDGFLLRVCAEALANPDFAFVVLLDEINRCNVPKVMGELLTTMERSKRARWTGTAWDVSGCQVVQLPQSQRQFFMPDNVFLIGTMNSSDRSITALDSALRRRFEFVKLNPVISYAKAAPERLRLFLEALNAWAMKHVGDQAQLGHSYLMNMEYDAQSILYRLNRSVLPDLAESITLAGLAADLSAEAASSALRDELQRLGVEVEQSGELPLDRLVLTIRHDVIVSSLLPSPSVAPVDVPSDDPVT